MTRRFEVRLTREAPAPVGCPPEVWAAMEPAGSADTPSEALRLILAALAQPGVTYACQVDTRPDDPPAVSSAEREALAAITPKMARTMTNA